jgi:hypothetical protein
VRLLSSLGACAKMHKRLGLLSRLLVGSALPGLTLVQASAAPLWVLKSKPNNNQPQYYHCLEISRSRGPLLDLEVFRPFSMRALLGNKQYATMHATMHCLEISRVGGPLLDLEVFRPFSMRPLLRNKQYATTA